VNKEYSSTVGTGYQRTSPTVFCCYFLIFFVCVLQKPQQTQNHRDVPQVMRGKYARKTGVVTEEKNIAHVYRSSSAQMTDVFARAKLYPN
jgi:hypothetical protein